MSTPQDIFARLGGEVCDPPIVMPANQPLELSGEAVRARLCVFVGENGEEEHDYQALLHERYAGLVGQAGPSPSGALAGLSSIARVPSPSAGGLLGQSRANGVGSLAPLAQRCIIARVSSSIVWEVEPRTRVASA